MHVCPRMCRFYGIKKFLCDIANVAKELFKLYECADSESSAVINVPIKVVIITTPTVNTSIMNASHSIMKRFITASVAFIPFIHCDFSHISNNTF